MLIYAGIDEAGYGPMLGPLCIACAAFVLDDHDPSAGPCDLWKRLSSAVCRKKTDKRRRIAIDDSKKLKLANDAAAHPLKFLERGVLSFAATLCDGCDTASMSDRIHPDCPSCDDELFGLFGVDVGDAAWYRTSTPLPVASEADELRIAANRLRIAARNQGVHCAMLRCEAIDAHRFNEQVARMGSKASVNFCAVMRMIDAVWRRWPAEHPQVIIDRQGGRTHYLRELLQAYPEAKIRILEESDVTSRYQLEDSRGSAMTLTFQVEAELAHFPVALASMTAKYVRELMMLRLNRYFQALMPELKPTAGYVEDGRRFLAQIEPLIESLGVERSSLIRSV